MEEWEWHHRAMEEQEPAHDVLAAEAYAMPAPDPALHHHEPIVLPEDPTGISQPHDILAAEEFPMPAPRPAPVMSRRDRSRSAALGIAVASAAALGLIRGRRAADRGRGRSSRAWRSGRS